jgi:hypothetical protein
MLVTFPDAPQVLAAWVNVQVRVPDSGGPRGRRICRGRASAGDPAQALAVCVAEPGSAAGSSPCAAAVFVHCRCDAVAGWRDIAAAEGLAPADEHVTAIGAVGDVSSPSPCTPDGSDGAASIVSMMRANTGSAFS